ncbi:MAG TPA: hypothetical protein ENJ82_10675 [Bacteroidetes bacterium]|nr:hypothetical protein [Bacteroidota bacterium]
MILQSFRHICALTFLALMYVAASAQPFQVLQAYTLNDVDYTGIYSDVVNLSSAAANPGSPVAVGHTKISPATGLITIMQTNGTPISMYQVVNSLGNSVLSRAICRAVNDDLIACFYDPGIQATDVIRLSAAGVILWQTRLPGFQVEDVICDDVGGVMGEVVWLTGKAMAQGQVAIEAISGAGAAIFGNAYGLVNPNWAYQSAKGFCIQLNAAKTNLTVAGTAITATGQSEMVVLRTALNGGLIWAKGYGDPAGTDFYHGKCLVQRPGTGNRFAIGVEYSNVAAAQNQAAAMMINAAGNPLWIRAYTGGGFFAGLEYIVHDIDVDNNRLLICGNFDSDSKAGTTKSAFSLALRLNGAGLQFNEYETTGLFPAGDNGFMGMDFNPVVNHHVMVGSFTTSDIIGSWPWGNDPNSFWAVAANQLGIANCSTNDDLQSQNLTPTVAVLTNNVVALPNQAQSPLTLAQVGPLVASQCGVAKHALAAELEAVKTETVQIGYREATEQIVLNVQGELTGSGTFQLLNLQGQILAELAATSGEMVFGAAQLSHGIYLVRYTLPGLGHGVRKVMVW